MANKVYNMEGGLHSAAAYSAFENAMYGSCVASATDFVASAGTGMNISLSAGNGMIDTGQGYSRRIASDATNTIPVTAASSANPRMDAVVAYIDNGVTPTTSVIDNTNNILKFACVAGSPAATPQAPSAATIQSAIGAGNPYVILWYVTIPTSATSLSSATFTDNRYVANKINSANIADGAVTSAKIANGSISKTALAGMPCPDYDNVITTWGDISETVTRTTTASGYIVGKVLIIGARQKAYIEINGIPVGGIPYNDTSVVNNLQVAFCIPVANNTEVKFYASGASSGRFEGCKLVGWKLG